MILRSTIIGSGVAITALLSTNCNAFTPQHYHRTSITTTQSTKLHQQPPQQFYDANGNPIYPVQFYDENGNPIYPDQQYQEEQPSLILGNMAEEMAAATSGVDVPLDYLALARERAAAKVESSNSDSSDEEWFQMADEKKRQFTNPDIDWENFDPADTELDEANAAARLGGGGEESGDDVVQMEEYGDGGIMMTEGGLVVDNVEGEDGPQLLI